MIVTKRFDQISEDIVYMTHVSREEFHQPINIIVREVIRSISDKITEEIMKANDIKSMISFEDIKESVLVALSEKIALKLKE